MTPPAPNPFCRFTQKNYLIVAWREPIVAAAYGDIDGDGRPDVAVLVPKGRGSAVKIYLNHGGKFAERPDAEIELSDLERGNRLRIVRMHNGPAADFFVASEDHAELLLAEPGRLKYKAERLEVTRASEAAAEDFGKNGEPGLLIGSRFVDSFYIAERERLRPKTSASGTHDSTGGAASQRQNDLFRVRQTNHPIEHYLQSQIVDIDGDKRDDLITSNGDIFLRRPDGSLAETPAFHLAPPPSESKGWTWVAAADFEHNGRTDVALLGTGPIGAIVWLYRNTGDPRAPFAKDPNTKFVVPGAEVNRDGPTIADWNGDGRADLILCKRGNEGGALVLTGSSADGLSPKRITPIKLDYIPYYDARFGVADFTGDGRLGLAGFGRSPTGTMGVYIWLQLPPGP